MERQRLSKWLKDKCKFKWPRCSRCVQDRDRDTGAPADCSSLTCLQKWSWVQPAPPLPACGGHPLWRRPPCSDTEEPAGGDTQRFTSEHSEQLTLYRNLRCFVRPVVIMPRCVWFCPPAEQTGRCGWVEPHKVSRGLWQQSQRHQDATGRVHVRQRGQDVIVRHRTFDLWRRTHHGGRTVWHPEGEVQLEDTKRVHSDVSEMCHWCFLFKMSGHAAGVWLTWEKLTAACRAEEVYTIMVTNLDTSALDWKTWGKPEGREETQTQHQSYFLPPGGGLWNMQTGWRLEDANKHTWVVCEAVCVDVSEPLLELRVLLHLTVCTVIQIHPPDHEPVTCTHNTPCVISASLYTVRLSNRKLINVKGPITWLRCVCLPVQGVPDSQCILGIVALWQLIHATVRQIVRDTQRSIVNPLWRPGEEDG